MIIFNCTKAAEEQLTRTRQGKKISIIDPAPHKTIAESIQSPETMDGSKRPAFQWHWVVHCVSVKRKKYWVVMDYHTRYCIVFPAGKKGDELIFMQDFKSHLLANFHCQADKDSIEETVIYHCIEQYNRRICRTIFHQRGDRSVMTHIKEVVWQLEDSCYEKGMIVDKADCLYFALYCNFIPRSTKNSKGYFYPSEEFLKYWLEQFEPPRKSSSLRVVH